MATHVTLRDGSTSGWRLQQLSYLPTVDMGLRWNGRVLLLVQ